MHPETSLRRLVLLLVAMGLLSTGPAHAQARCPWLNVATASGALQGPAVLEVQKLSETQTICVFRYQKEEMAYVLQISVMSQQDPSKGLAQSESECSSAVTPLRAIGNEAVLCADDRRHLLGEEVVGRVRGSVFRVSISSRNDPDMTREVLEQKSRNIAEQIAGSLF
jgi:hypothetical protein